MFNRITILGHIGGEIRFKKGTDDKSSLIRFSVATNSWYGNEEQTTWHTIVAFGKLAEYLHERIGRGTLLLINGTLRQYRQDDKNYLNVYADTVRIVSKQKREAEEKPSPQPENEGKTEGDEEDLPF